MQSRELWTSMEARVYSIVELIVAPIYDLSWVVLKLRERRTAG